ncbi:amidohydrolase [Saccharopolyspora antimicrobica]|uniref:amidohydrolase n=1 Tax=Saccharopolyspora antimicrobica TaxID=455193 RepID=UPI000A898A29|nr:amidohydrolase [Saccharopolyspora antimicrobica]
MPDSAERIFTGGPVLTMDDAAPEAEALAVRGGEIIAVGRAADVLALRGPSTQVVDLDGRALLPGFIEAHGHPSTMALTLAPPAIDVRPFTVPTGAEVYERIRATVAAAPGKPVGAYGIDLLLQRDLALPTRQRLDELCPDAPLVVVSNSGHAAYGNTAALRAAGITADTLDPPGARFVRDAAGEPTGEVRETAALLALFEALGDFRDDAQVSAALDWAFAEHARVGITTATDMATDPRTVPALRDAAESPGAVLRIRSYLIGTPELAAEPERRFPGHAPASEMFGISGMKLWADGTPWQGSVATSFPFKDNDATLRIGMDHCAHGPMNYSPDQLADLVAAFAGQGFPLACHVHGDVTVEAVLDAYAKAGAGDPEMLRAMRPRLEHCGAVTADQYRRAADMGATVSLFMDHIRWWGDVLADDLFGPEVADRWMSARSAWDAGHRVSLHNDGVCSPTDPLSSVATAITRRSHPSGRIHGTYQCLTIDEALRAVTANPAWQLHLEDEIGMLRMGMRADLVVLSRDPRTVPAEHFREAVAVSATYLSGQRTWPR